MRISDWSSDVCSSDLDPYDWRALRGMDRSATQREGRGHSLWHRHRWTGSRPGWEGLCGQSVGRNSSCLRRGCGGHRHCSGGRSEEHTSELQSLMRISYAVFCLKKKNTQNMLQTSHRHVNK